MELAAHIVAVASLQDGFQAHVYGPALVALAGVSGCVSLQVAGRPYAVLLDVVAGDVRAGNAAGEDDDVAVLEVPLSLADDLQLSYDGAHPVTVRAVVDRSRFELERVVLSAPDVSRVLRAMRDRPNAASWQGFVLDSIVGWPMVVRRGIELLENVCVHDCTPFSEGFIAKDTVLAVLPSRPVSARVVPTRLHDSHAHLTAAAQPPLILSAFAEPPRACVSVTARVLAGPASDVVEVSVGLLKRLGVFSSSLCTLTSAAGVARAVRVCSSARLASDDEAGLSPLLMLNAFSTGGRTLAVAHSATAPAATLQALHVSPPSCTEVRLGRIGASGGEEAAALLALYFATPRVVCIDDVLCLPLGGSRAAAAMPSAAAAAAFSAPECAMWRVLALQPAVPCALVQRDSCAFLEGAARLCALLQLLMLRQMALRWREALAHALLCRLPARPLPCCLWSSAGLAPMHHRTLPRPCCFTRLALALASAFACTRWLPRWACRCCITRRWRLCRRCRATRRPRSERFSTMHGV